MIKFKRLTEQQQFQLFEPLLLVLANAYCPWRGCDLLFPKRAQGAQHG